MEQSGVLRGERLRRTIAIGRSPPERIVGNLEPNQKRKRQPRHLNEGNTGAGIIQCALLKNNALLFAPRIVFRFR
jgi:hypothetical protein